MALKKRDQLKDIFNGLSSLYYTSEDYDFDGTYGEGVDPSSFAAFAASKAYKVGDKVKNGEGNSVKYYVCKEAHTSASAIDTTKFNEVTPTLNIEWQYELPVTVDSLQISQDDPTINHYKVIGLQGDWASTAEAGDFTIQFTVPTKHTDVIKLAFGEDAYSSMAGVKMTDLGDGTWGGGAVTINMKKVTGTIGLLDETKSNIMLVRNISLYAKPLYENPSTEPFAIQFSGSIETTGDSNFAWLKKQ